jgi:hypothetical protein
LPTDAARTVRSADFSIEFHWIRTEKNLLSTALAERDLGVFSLLFSFFLQLFFFLFPDHDHHQFQFISIFSALIAKTWVELELGVGRTPLSTLVELSLRILPLRLAFLSCVFL